MSTELIDQTLELLLTRVVAGEEKTTGKTEQFDFRIEKRVAYDLSGRNFTDGEEGGEALGFYLPNATVLFNGTDFPKGELSITVSKLYSILGNNGSFCSWISLNLFFQFIKIYYLL